MFASSWDLDLPCVSRGPVWGNFVTGPAPATLVSVQGRYIMRALTISASPNQTILRYITQSVSRPLALYFLYPACRLVLTVLWFQCLYNYLGNKPHSLPVCKRLCPSQHRGTQGPRAATCESNNYIVS
ncbi:hypothetical protein FOIG_05957 [Fusarium odoratissimum NRRL 54006]|uniref:Uncharacterized protein n=2 Tax=Fusarium oxysporum species complex TaxID=171631 RepID=X0K324_FUSO5|nr:uncharacterized protein FOIG_05957 [Fusarium odoratissimum NRRL 54006]EXM03041.1 hypothetical protein FOIG_05957 [Fusarium odoratissimum NRRL 54006]TXC11089.1 hypothetical protein FocTR4_00007202 [Fusarium oxysporum f. sp. cubense]